MSAWTGVWLSDFTSTRPAVFYTHVVVGTRREERALRIWDCPPSIATMPSCPQQRKRNHFSPLHSANCSRTSTVPSTQSALVRNSTSRLQHWSLRVASNVGADHSQHLPFNAITFRETSLSYSAVKTRHSAQATRLLYRLFGRLAVS